MALGRKTTFELAALLLVVALGLLAIVNQQQIRDWWVLRNYDPPAEIMGLSQRADLTERGQQLFLASQPELNDREQFNDNCQFPDKSLILGCYSRQRIYIFDVQDERLDGVKEVTAAHEMLHAAYDRFSADKREQVDTLVSAAYDEMDDERITSVVENYEDDSHGTLNNELHSILGTEADELPSELEEHYKQYFNDRSTIVGIASEYEEVFNQIQEEIADYDRRVASLRSRIDSTEQTLAREQTEIEQEATRLQGLREDGRIEEYNQAVPGFNTAVNTYNARIETYASLVQRHNRLVNERNELALEQNQLVHSLDSKFQPIESQ